MSIVTRMRMLGVAGFGAAMIVAAPAFAQMDETKGDTVPTCSASVTDHCITRGMPMRGMHMHGMNMHGMRHMHHRHMHHMHHHHMHK